jgi:hypothetical protein
VSHFHSALHRRRDCQPHHNKPAPATAAACGDDSAEETAALRAVGDMLRNHITDHAFSHMDVRGCSRIVNNEDAMAKVEQADGGRRIVETPTEARQAEPGPSVLALLSISTIAAIFVLAIVWFLFFRT